MTEDTYAQLLEKIERLEQPKSYFKDKIIPPVVVAFIFGLVGIYGTYITYGTRIAQIELRQDRIELQTTSLGTTVNSVAVDVAFIRGKIEGRP